jgi:hypothetical protein
VNAVAASLVVTAGLMPVRAGCACPVRSVRLAGPMRTRRPHDRGRWCEEDQCAPNNESPVWWVGAKSHRVPGPRGPTGQPAFRATS